MYDKYFSLNPITLDGSKILKCKGILVNNTSATAAGVTFYFVNRSGNTFQTALTFPQGANILSIEPFGLPAALPAGCTAFTLN
jgi:hypothetical protein